MNPWSSSYFWTSSITSHRSFYGRHDPERKEEPRWPTRRWLLPKPEPKGRWCTGWRWWLRWRRLGLTTASRWLSILIVWWRILRGWGWRWSRKTSKSICFRCTFIRCRLCGWMLRWRGRWASRWRWRTRWTRQLHFIWNVFGTKLDHLYAVSYTHLTLPTIYSV